ncbi:MAG: anti-sigma factor [Burkholderiaceae bacterium]|nr:anti-sigma factor [Burkholderiaceae bacterium]
MRLHEHPELLDRLAASYALGTLRGGARRRFETLARQQPAVQAACQHWLGRMASLTELQPAITPPPYVWTRIQNQLQLETTPRLATPPRGAIGWWQSLALWRTMAAAGVCATVAAVVVGLQVNQGLRSEAGAQIAELRQQLQATPQIQYVAVLADEKSTASMLVTIDPTNNTLVLQRVSGFQEGGDRSLQLWALPPSGAPRSLGVLGQGPLVKLTAAEADVREVPTLAISLEPRGGVPGAGGPTGPVLFKGSLIQRML